jgi:hypothetical protein
LNFLERSQSQISAFSWDFYLFSNVVTVGECPVVAPRQCYPLLHHADSSTSLVIQIDLSDSFTLRMRFIEVFACTLDRPKYKVTLSLMNREVTLYIIHLCGAFRHLSLHKCAINSRNFFTVPRNKMINGPFSWMLFHTLWNLLIWPCVCVTSCTSVHYASSAFCAIF